MHDNVPIASTDFWVKVIEMLQQNWALIEPAADDGVRIYFISDSSGVFEEISCPSLYNAHEALRAWLTYVLGRIADHKITRIHELLPWRYAAVAA